MSVYTEYDVFRRQVGPIPEKFMRTCLEQAEYPANEIDSLVAAMSDTVDNAMKNLKTVMRSPAPVPELEEIIKGAMKKLSSVVMGDEDLDKEQKKSFLGGVFGWLTGSSWRETRRMTETMAKQGDEPEETVSSQEWDALDPKDAALPEDKERNLDVGKAAGEVARYLAEASYNHDVLALGCAASEIGKSLDDAPLAEGAVPQIVVDALTSDLLSSEETEFKKIAALDYFLRMSDVGPEPSEQNGWQPKRGLQLLAVKAAHDAFIQANDLKAAFKRLQNEAGENLFDGGKEADHV